MSWQQHLASPIFDTVRIPGILSFVRLAERVCADHGTTVEAFKAKRSKCETRVTIAIRKDILIAARQAGISPSVVAKWFGHRDSTIVILWHDEIASEEA